MKTPDVIRVNFVTRTKLDVLQPGKSFVRFPPMVTCVSDYVFVGYAAGHALHLVDLTFHHNNLYVPSHADLRILSRNEIVGTLLGLHCDSHLAQGKIVHIHDNGDVGIKVETYTIRQPFEDVRIIT